MKTALVCIAKDEDKYLDEWVSYHLKLGFTNIFVIRNNWNYESKYCFNTRRVFFTDYNEKHSLTQYTAYRLALEKLYKDFDWIAFFDVDEFLVLKKHRFLEDFLKDYDDFKAIGINWRMFGDAGLKTIENGNYSVIDRFTKCGKSLNKHIKTMIHTAKTGNSVYVHSCSHCVNDFNSDIQVNLAKNFMHGAFNEDSLDEIKDIAYLAHFRTKTFEECMEKAEKNKNGIYYSISSSYNEEYFNEFNENDVEDLSLKNNIKSAICVVAKDEDQYIDEWIEYNLALGFDKIHIYQNFWKYSGKFKNDSHIELVDFDIEYPQRSCYLDFFKKNWFKYDFAACFDVDEFLLLKKHNDIEDFLRNYKKFPAIGVNMRLFGDSGLSKVENGNYSVIQRFKKSDKNLQSLIKIIFNFNVGQNKFYLSNPHIPNCQVIDPNLTKTTTSGNFFNNTEDECAELAHYRNKTWEEFYNRKYMKDDCFYGKIETMKKNNPNFGQVDLNELHRTFDECNKNDIDNTSILDFWNKIKKS